MTRPQRFGAMLLALIATAVVVGPVSPASAGGPKGSNSTIAVVLLDSTDGVAHYGQRVTFTVSTTATAKPMVQLDCYQGGTHVYWASAGFYEGYPWPWNREFRLTSSYWTGGAADCTATLYSNGRNGRIVTHASTSFPVAA